MALQLIRRLTFVGSANVANGYNNADVVTVNWDDVALGIVVQKNSVTIGSGLSITSAQTLTSGPGGGITQVTNYNDILSGYSFCTLAKLTNFTPGNVFPYATRVDTANSSLCPVTTSDIRFTGPPIVVYPSTGVATDGSITITGLSSLSSVKYSLTDVPYASMVNTTGVFTGLNVGSYVVYCRDSFNFKISSSVLLVVRGTLVSSVPSTYNLVYTVVFANTANASTFTTGDTLQIYWDTATNGFFCFKNGAALTSGQILTTPLTSNGVLPATLNYTVYPTGYQFCTGATLTTFTTGTTFPYSVMGTTPNCPKCIAYVCDIKLIGSPVVIRPTTTTSFDGSIQVTALSSLGTSNVRYSLSNVPYSVGLNSTGLFTGLGPGSYTIWAIDLNGCTAATYVTLTQISTYGLQYSFSYFNLIGVHSKIDILQDGYTGATTQLTKTDADPIMLRLNGNNLDKYTAILPSEATVNLLSINNEDWIPLFSAVERQFRVVFYQDYGSGYVEIWRGFLTPRLYSESYTIAPYPVSFDCTDQLATLSNYPFADDAGNPITGNVSLIKVISTILKKTGLSLGIRSGINLFETTMSQGLADDPLAQTFIDCDSYTYTGTTLTCDVILSDILRSFGASIRQYSGAWWLTRFEECTASYKYRDFDFEGNYITNGSFNPLIDFKASNQTSRMVWTGTSAVMEGVSSYGRFDLTQQLFERNSLVKNETFEKVSGTNTKKDISFDGWTQVLNGTANYLQAVKGNGSNTAAYLRDSIPFLTYDKTNVPLLNSIPFTDSYLLGTPFAIIQSAADQFTLKFDYYPAAWKSLGTVFPTNLKFWFRFRLTQDGRSIYLQDDGTWSTDPNRQWVGVVISNNYNAWTDFQITANFPPDQSQFGNCTGDLALMAGRFIRQTINGSAGLTGTTTAQTQLQAITTTDKNVGYLLWVCDNQPSGFTYITNINYYKLTITNAAASYPGTVRPNDYDATTNRVEWVLQSTDFVSDGGLTYTRYGMVGGGEVSIFDNVILKFLPGGQPAPATLLHTRTNNVKISSVWSNSIFHGDVPQYSTLLLGSDVTTNPSLFTNAKNIYLNYYRKQDGSPTSLWTRPGRSEQQSILALLTKSLLEQFQNPTFRITGNFSNQDPSGNSGITPSFVNTFRDNGRYFTPVGMIINDRINSFQTEMIQFVNAADSTSSAYGAGFKTAAFGGGYNIT